jgi:hypothetical protein
MGVTEVRLCGGNSPPVTRRLEAMFEQLLRIVPEERCGVLCRQMGILRRTIDSTFAEPEDCILAGVADLQGLGGGQRDHAAVRS